MGVFGCLFHAAKAGMAALQGDSTKVNKELDKSIEVLRRPPLSELGDAISDLMER